MCVCMCVLLFILCCSAVTVKSVAGLSVSICSCCHEEYKQAAGLSTALRGVKKEGGRGEIWVKVNTWKTISES